MSNEEEILCLPTSVYIRACNTLQADQDYDHASSDTRMYARVKVLIDTVSSWQRRGSVETDESWLQVIPYALLQQDGRLFSYRRIGGDERLLGRYSFGVGGHVTKDKTHPSMGSVENSLFRELAEELDLSDYPHILECQRLIYRTDTQIDRVHLGMLYLATLEKGETAEVKETDNLEGKWLSRQEVLTLSAEELEPWSRVAREYWRNQ